MPTVLQQNFVLLTQQEKKLEAEIKKTAQTGNEASYDLELIMDESKTFFFAGHDTSAQLLTWTMMLLATNAKWQEKVRAEVMEVCGGGVPTANHLPKLTVLQMIIYESLRLYPPRQVFYQGWHFKTSN